MRRDPPLPMLGGLSAATFLRRHWQKKPLPVRAALPGALAGVDRARLFALAMRDDVESRLIARSGARWTVRQGPLARRALPRGDARACTLLVQGVDLHDDAAHRLLRRFRFVPDARLDDVMCSWAADGGGVGPHVDSYDVFLLQTLGRRRWRIGRSRRNAPLRDDVPLKMLAEFVPTDEWLLEPGDMLYLPPGWGHDGVAVGECITASVGFRAPERDPLAAEMLDRIAELAHERVASRPGSREQRYRDAGSRPAEQPARVPSALQQFANGALDEVVDDATLRAQALGELLTEPKPGTSFGAATQPSGTLDPTCSVALDRRTRMLYDDRFVFINGESLHATGRDAALMRRLADERCLEAADVARASGAARVVMAEWLQAGWCMQPGNGFDSEEEAT